MPSQRFKKAAALAAALAYSLVAVGGYGLHGLAHFGHSDCHGHSLASAQVAGEPELSLETLVADAGTCCAHEGHVHGEQTKSESAPHGLALRDSGSGHDHHNCTICAILAQVKVGHQLSTLAISSLELCESHTVLETSQDFLQPILSADARGPPTLLV